MRNKILLYAVAIVLFASCSSQKQAVRESRTHHANPAVAFVEEVIDHQTEVENIVGSASLRMSMGEESMKLSGALRMRRNQVVRLQLMLPIIGTEVGRIEFTPDYVLIVDRMNKQYIKTNYSDVDFLVQNNITFYSLQALFWDELISSAHTTATRTDAEEFQAKIDGEGNYVPISRQEGSTLLQWNANRSDYTLTSAVLTHGTSILTWYYSNFTSLGAKKFPRTQEFSFSATINGKPRKASLTIDLSEIKTSSDWDAETQVSAKYKEVRAETILSRLMNM